MQGLRSFMEVIFISKKTPNACMRFAITDNISLAVSLKYDHIVYIRGQGHLRRSYIFIKQIIHNQIKTIKNGQSKHRHQ